MTWEQLVIPVLLVLALLVQLLRALKGAVEEEQGQETEATSIPVTITRGVPIQASRGPSDAPRVKQPAMEAVPATRRGRARITAMRRGIVLMAVLGPCRGMERSAPPGE